MICKRASFIGLLGLLGCGGPAETEPGRETGECVDYQCLGDLVCLSNLCVDPDGTPPGTGGPQDGTGDTGDTGDTVPQPLTSASVLVVLDNSGSMGEEQAVFTSGLMALAGALTDAGVDWRIGVTTTDNGNVWCTSTDPERGNLQLSSCRSRPNEFVFNGAIEINAFPEVCEALCPAAADTIDLPNPWIESIDGTTNLPAGLSVSDAIGCTVPQGISGCGFEQPLESMRLALVRARTGGEANEGFLPDDALLVVVIVTDEADCSHNPDFDDIFEPDGDRTFWSDPSAPAPTSAVCWNAGVSCTAGNCESVDLDRLGDTVGPESAETSAVLRPVSRYLEELDMHQDALLVHIGGYQANGSVIYQEGDPEEQGTFGIGPGCTSTAGPAVPPVRVREVADHVAAGDVPSTVSICSSSYETQLTQLATAIVTRLAP